MVIKTIYEEVIHGRGEGHKYGGRRIGEHTASIQFRKTLNDSIGQRDELLLRTAQAGSVYGWIGIVFVYCGYKPPLNKNEKEGGT